MKPLVFRESHAYQPGDRVILPTGEAGKLPSKPNPVGWIVIRDRDMKRFYYREDTLREEF